MARDTDRDWQAIGLARPYWGVLARRKYLNLHKNGHPDEDALREFFASGEADVALIQGELRHAFGAFESRSALDFGCGVGRLVIPMARICGTAHGVDIADSMIAVAKANCDKAGVKATFSNRLESNRRFDWVNSLLVLQHIAPRRGYGVIRELWESVGQNGCLSLRVTTHADIRRGGNITQSLWRTVSGVGNISMYNYDLGRVLSRLALDNGAYVSMRKTDHRGANGFVILARKPG